ncbi:MAG: YlxR family protein [Bacilli bacterium]|nr:YlxR family protein [Bacilli bacterium]
MMKNKKIPMRSCVVTKEKLPKAELLRVVKTPEGMVLIDTTGKMNGRGAYIKRDITVLEKAKKSKILDRVLETVVADNVYEEIYELINK